MTVKPEFATDANSAEIDDDLETLLLPELKFVGQGRPHVAALYDKLARRGAGDDQPYAIGLALSGGGIRSASVSLGAMQRLAAGGVLKQVDYLSTVSGGGYIGSALTWWLRPQRQALPAFDADANFPFGTEDPRDPEKQKRWPLEFLRQNGRYLIPGNGITIWSGAAVVLRSILLNLLVWVPVAALAILLLFALGSWPTVNGVAYFVSAVAPGVLQWLNTTIGSSGSVAATELFPPAFLLMLLISAGLFVLYLLSSFNHSLLSWTGHAEDAGDQQDRRPRRPIRYGWIWAGLVGVAGLAVLAVVAIWLAGVAPGLFASVANRDAPAGGLHRQWQWILAFALIVAFLAVWFEGRGWSPAAIARTFTRQKGVSLVILAFLVLWGLDYVLTRFSATTWTFSFWTLGRLSAALQFIAGIGFLAFANFWVGLGIRHVLRFEALPAHARGEEPDPLFLEYNGRRLFEKFFGLSLQLSVALVALGSLPLVDAYITYVLGGWQGAASLALGTVSTAIGNLRAKSRGDSRLTNFFIVAGALLFVYGVLLIGYRLATGFMIGDVGARALIATLIFVAIISGWFANVNYVGLHRYYRDRLMEAFMPDDGIARNGLNEAAREANGLWLQNAWGGKEAKGPFHIINTNAVLTNSKNRKYRGRGGDNFILSPLYMGSSATGWAKASDFADGKISLASAMAASGAAANPRGGVGGKGITRRSSVALVMGLLSIRLGYWLRNPAHVTRGFWSRRATHFWPGGVYALMGRGYSEDSKWIEVADGGHFENLAVYELIRRRCGLIIVCDGGQDNASSYADLVTAVQRVGQDFGAAIRFNMMVLDKKSAGWKPSGPAQIIAKSDNRDYPKGAEFADKGYCVATIEYGPRGGGGWPEFGTLIYLKSALLTELDIRAKGYRGAHADFPNQSTGDQFYDEEQFEAYREVGYRICDQMINDLCLEELFAERPALDKLRENDKFRVS